MRKGRKLKKDCCFLSGEAAYSRSQEQLPFASWHHQKSLEMKGDVIEMREQFEIQSGEKLELELEAEQDGDQDFKKQEQEARISITAQTLGHASRGNNKRGRRTNVDSRCCCRFQRCRQVRQTPVGCSLLHRQHHRQYVFLSLAVLKMFCQFID